MNDAFTKLYTRVARVVDHDSALERLIEDLMSGSVKWGPDREFTAAEILEGEELLNNSAWYFLCRVLSAHKDERVNLLDLARKQVRTILSEWCRTNDYGIDLWRMYCEPEEE